MANDSTATPDIKIKMFWGKILNVTRWINSTRMETTRSRYLYTNLLLVVNYPIAVINHQHSNGSSGKEKSSFRKERRRGEPLVPSELKCPRPIILQELNSAIPHSWNFIKWQVSLFIILKGYIHLCENDLFEAKLWKRLH